MPLSRCWKWIVEFMRFLFQTSSRSSSIPPPPQVELCNNLLFEIFLRIPPEALPRLSCINKQSYGIINSPLFQTMYWTQKLRLPRLYAIVYYQRKLNSRIGFALTIKEYGQRLDKTEFHTHRQLPHFGFPPSSYSRLLQWAESMLQFQYHETDPDGIKIRKWNGCQSRSDAMNNHSEQNSNLRIRM